MRRFCWIPDHKRLYIVSLICKDDIYIMTFTEYIKDKYHIDDVDKIAYIYCIIIHIDEIINNGVNLSTEDAVNYYQSNYDILDYFYCIYPERYDNDYEITIIFPQCDYFYYTKKYFHYLICCLYNNEIMFTYDKFKYSCLHLNDNERDIILNILNKRNMVEHIAILLDTKPIGGDSKNFDL